MNPASSTKDPLIQLIKSLSASEKRYFKLFASVHKDPEESKYLRLFECLDKVVEYDEKAFRALHEKEKFAKYFPQDKVHLFQMILKAMRQYCNDKSSLVEAYGLLQDAEFLYSKGLYERSERQIERARKVAKDNGHYAVLIELIGRHKQLILEQSESELRKRMEEGIDDQLQASSILDAEMRYENNYQRIFMRLREEAFTHNQATINYVAGIMRKRMYESEDYAPTVDAKINFHLAKAAYARLIGEFEQFRAHYHAVLELFNTPVITQSKNQEIIIHKTKKENKSHKETSAKKQPELKKHKEPKRYKKALSNYLNACHLLEDYSEFDKVIKEMESIPSNGLDDDAETFQNAAHLKLLRDMNLGDFEAAYKSLPTISKDLKRFESKINPARSFAFLYNFAITSFFNENWSDTRKWLEEIMARKSQVQRSDIFAFARILYLIVQYELGNIDIVEREYKSVLRWLVKRNRYGSYEQLLLNSMLQLAQAPQKSHKIQEKSVFEKIHQDFFTFLQATSSKTSLGAKEIFCWLTNKVENKRIADLARERCWNRTLTVPVTTVPKLL